MTPVASETSDGLPVNLRTSSFSREVFCSELLRGGRCNHMESTSAPLPYMAVTATLTVTPRSISVAARPKSCTECARRKVKCSRTQPCDQCVSMKTTDICKQPEKKPRRKPVRRKMHRSLSAPLCMQVWASVPSAIHAQIGYIPEWMANMLIYGHRQFSPDVVSRTLLLSDKTFNIWMASNYDVYLTQEQVQIFRSDVLEYTAFAAQDVFALDESPSFSFQGIMKIPYKIFEYAEVHLHTETVDDPSIPAATMACFFASSGKMNVIFNEAAEQLWGYTNAEVDWRLQNPPDVLHCNRNQKVAPFLLSLFTPSSHPALNLSSLAMWFLNSTSQSYYVDILRKDGRSYRMHCIWNLYHNTTTGVNIECKFRARNILVDGANDDGTFLSSLRLPKTASDLHETMLECNSEHPDIFDRQLAAPSFLESDPDQMPLPSDIVEILVRGHESYSPFVHRDRVRTGQIDQFLWVASAFLLPEQVMELRVSLQKSEIGWKFGGSKLQQPMTDLEQQCSAIRALHSVLGENLLELDSVPQIFFRFGPNSVEIELNTAAQIEFKCTNEEAATVGHVDRASGIRRRFAPVLLTRIEPSCWPALAALFVSIWFREVPFAELSIRVFSSTLPERFLVLTSSSASNVGPIDQIALALTNQSCCKFNADDS